MIILYFGVSSRASRQAIEWFSDYDIEVKKKRIEQISRVDLKQILTLSENGFQDILKSTKCTGTQIHTIKKEIKQSSFEEALDCLMKHLNILKVPIIFDEHKLVIGYNVESIRTFITKDYRKSKRYRTNYKSELYYKLYIFIIISEAFDFECYKVSIDCALNRTFINKTKKSIKKDKSE